MEALHLAYCQTSLAWHDWTRNRENFSNLLSELERGVDLILLPETFASGFSMQPQEIAQTMDGPAVEWMTAQSQKLDAVVLGSLVIVEQGRFYNRLVCARQDGSIAYYNKRHLFTYAGEGEKFTGGEHRLIISIKGWRICPLICYDLRFPVWSRFRDDYDVLVYVANWPTPRIDAWETLLRARAIENQAYVVGVNRIGTDGNGYAYSGRSQVIDFKGSVMQHSADNITVGTASLEYPPLQDFRRQYNFLADRDAFILD